MRGGCGIRTAIILAIATIALLVYGGNGIWNGVRYTHPETLTMEQFLMYKPTAGWYHITGGLIDVVEEGHLIKKGAYHRENDIRNLTRAYIPVYNAKTFPDGPDSQHVHLLLYSSDPAIAETIRGMGENENAPSQAYLQQNKDRLLLQKDIEGMVKSGLDSESEEHKRLLESHFEGLDRDYVVLDEGAKPSLWGGLGLFALGIVLAIMQVQYYVRSIRG